MGLWRVIAVALLLLAAAPHEGENLASRTDASRPLTISAPDWPPYSLDVTRPVGQRGLATEVLARCTARLGLGQAFVDFPINRMFKAMERGDLDVNIMSRKPEREAFLAFGQEPVFKNAYVPFVRANAKISIRRLADFDRWRVGDYVGIRASDEYRAYLDRRLAQGEEGRVDVVNDSDSLVKMLVKGRIDVTVGGKAELPWRARTLGFGARAIKALPFTLKEADYFIVVAKASPFLKKRPSLVADYDACLKAMRQDGTYKRLARAHGVD